MIAQRWRFYAGPARALNKSHSCRGCEGCGGKSALGSNKDPHNITDAHCQMLAEAVGAGDRTWQAYLSTITDDGNADVHARDRISAGPWYDAVGEGSYRSARRQSSPLACGSWHRIESRRPGCLMQSESACVAWL